MSNKKEIEIRFKLDKEKETEVLNKLKQIGWVSNPNIKQKDVYFCEKIYKEENRTKDCPYVVRIRTTNTSKTLTYKSFKGASDGGWVEIESDISDNSAIQSILEKIGQSAYLSINKERMSGKIEDNTIEINIDNIDGLGLFIEMEIFDDDELKGRSTLLKIAGKIGLSEKDVEILGYVQLMEKS